MCRKIPENSKFLLEKKHMANSKKQEKTPRKTGKSFKSRKKQENTPCSNSAFLFLLQSVSKSQIATHRNPINSSYETIKKKEKLEITLFFLNSFNIDQIDVFQSYFESF